MTPKYYEPEIWTIKKDAIYAAHEALKIGIENSEELLTEFELRFGRDTRSNKLTAEQMERDIAFMKKALENLKR